MSAAVSISIFPSYWPLLIEQLSAAQFERQIEVRRAAAGCSSQGWPQLQLLLGYNKSVQDQSQLGGADSSKCLTTYDLIYLLVAHIATKLNSSKKLKIFKMPNSAAQLLYGPVLVYARIGDLAQTLSVKCAN